MRCGAVGVNPCGGDCDYVYDTTPSLPIRKNKEDHNNNNNYYYYYYYNTMEVLHATRPQPGPMVSHGFHVYHL